MNWWMSVLVLSTLGEPDVVTGEELPPPAAVAAPTVPEGEPPGGGIDLAAVRAMLSQIDYSEPAATPAPSDDRVYGQLWLGSEGDTNVALATDEDASSQRRGVRALVEVQLGAAPVPAWKDFEVWGSSQFTRHLNNRDVLSSYDTLASLVGASFAPSHDDWRWQVSLTGLDYRANGVSDHLLQQGAMNLEALWAWGDFEVGAQAEAAARNFVDFNTDDDPADRDGGVYELGFVVSSEGASFLARLEASAVVELAQGSEQRQVGTDVLVFVTGRFGDVEWVTTLAQELRQYAWVDSPYVDRLWWASGSLTYFATEWLGVSLSASGFRNVLGESGGEVRRGTASLGVVGRL